MTKRIHQIFFDMGRGDLATVGNGRFLESHRHTKRFCRRHGFQYTLWDREAIERLVQKFPDPYPRFYHRMRTDIQRVDLAKYLILYARGGIYLDLDVHIQGRSAPQRLADLCRRDHVFVRWNDSNLPYNAVLGSKRKHPLFRQIIEECRASYLEKAKMPIYRKWKGRFVFQTTGHFMLQRVLKQWGILPDSYLDIMHIESKGKTIRSPDPLFYDTNASVWWGKD